MKKTWRLQPFCFLPDPTDPPFSELALSLSSILQAPRTGFIVIRFITLNYSFLSHTVQAHIPSEFALEGFLFHAVCYWQSYY